MLNSPHMFRDKSEAERRAVALAGQIGTVDSWGRITETLVGVEITERVQSGRPMFFVQPLIYVLDPFFDGCQPIVCDAIWTVRGMMSDDIARYREASHV